MSVIEDVEKFAEQARALISVGKYREALPLLFKALECAPKNPRLLCLITQAFDSLDEWDEAEKYADEAIAAAPDEEWGHRLRGLALRAKGDHISALAAMQEALRLAPREKFVLNTLVQAYLSVDDTEQAHRAAESLIATAPDWADSYIAMALVAMEEGDWEEAEQHCRKALSLAPLSYLAMNNLGLTLRHQARIEDAIDCFHQAVKLDPENAVARDNLKDAVTSYLESEPLPEPEIDLPTPILWMLALGAAIIFGMFFGGARTIGGLYLWGYMIPSLALMALL